MAKMKRGFALLSRAKRAEMSAMGGRASHKKGVAHRWTSEEARLAGKKGGQATKRNAPTRPEIE